MKRLISTSRLLATLALGLVASSEAEIKAQHGIAAASAGKFCGWPANNGLWSWDDGQEILVGFTYGDFVEQKGHNMKGGGEQAEGLMSRLARSTDGGLTWKCEDPGNYVGDGQSPIPSPGGIAFQAPGFAMRVVGSGYHGAHDTKGSFFVSENRGKDWKGSYQFNGLMEDPNLKGKVCTARTEYVVTGPDSCLLFMSSRGADEGYKDKSFVAETTDGGKTFKFISWIVPLDDPHRAVMPAVARQKDGSLVAALRRRNSAKGNCWVDAYGSGDNGRTWTFLSRVGEAGNENGNPPALVALKDGRLACAYGDRSRVKMYVRLSNDGGKTWDEEVVLRDDYQPDKFDDKDFGYPRLAVNHENHIVALYYWATKDQPQHHIAATLWKPGPMDNPDSGYRSRFSNDVASPGYYAVTLDDYKIRAEFTATTRSGFHRYTFPKTEQARVLFDLKFPSEYLFDLINADIKKISETEIIGYSRMVEKSYKGPWQDYILHFVIKFDKPFKSFGFWRNNETLTGTDQVFGILDCDIGAFVDYSTKEGEKVMVETGFSLVSIEQARLNLETETAGSGWDFDAARSSARKTWNDLLKIVEIEGGTEADKTN